MARRRGFFAEMQHQAKVAEREAELRRNRAARERQAAQRQAEQAYKAEQRAVAAFRQATAAQQKQLEREAKAAHVEAMQSEAARLNADLAAMYAEIDGLLAATLEVDDFVDLETLRRVVQHPPFPRRELEVVESAPPRLVAPERPTIRTVEPVKGLFGRKKKAEQAQALAEVERAAGRRSVDTARRGPAQGAGGGRPGACEARGSESHRTRTSAGDLQRGVHRASGRGRCAQRGAGRADHRAGLRYAGCRAGLHRHRAGQLCLPGALRRSGTRRSSRRRAPS